MIISPDHIQWDKFLKLLRNKLDFRQNEKGEVVWNCESNFDFTRRILKENFKNIDIDDTIKYFKEVEVNCDCEILFVLEYNIKENKFKEYLN